MNAGHISLADQQAAASSEASPAEVAHAEKAAFDQLIRTHQPQIVRLVSRLMAWPGDAAEVDDLVQEVFLTAWVKRSQFRGDAQPATWLSRIAINKTRNHARAKATWRTVIDRFHRKIANDTNSSGAAEPAAGLKNEQLRKALYRLKQSDRELIVLCYLEEKTPEEIAKLTGKKRNTIDARLSRARKRLRELMDAALKEEPR